MEILNVGPMELIFVVLLAFILVGPKEMIRLTRRAGQLIREASQSSFWKEVSHLNREIHDLPTRLVREAGYEEALEEIRSDMEKSIEIPGDLYKKSATIQSGPGEVRSSGRTGPRPTAPGAHWKTVPPEERPGAGVSKTAHPEKPSETLSESRTEQTGEGTEPETPTETASVIKPDADTTADAESNPETTPLTEPENNSINKE